MSAIGSTPATSGSTMSGSTSLTNPNATLDKNGFLKMFVAQMQNQDPSNAQDPNESTQLMATFSMVEQMTNLAMQSQTANAVGLLGRTVSYTDSTGAVQTGVVTSVSTGKGSDATLTVGDRSDIDPSTITSVA